jgi:catechol 2,3-dioxygenase-like lactoylglutathione lyase family enzyme
MTYPRTFSHIGLSVTNLEQAVDFYTKVFGWYVIMPPTEIVATSLFPKKPWHIQRSK